MNDSLTIVEHDRISPVLMKIRKDEFLFRQFYCFAVFYFRHFVFAIILVTTLLVPHRNTQNKHNS